MEPVAKKQRVSSVGVWRLVHDALKDAPSVQSLRNGDTLKSIRNRTVEKLTSTVQSVSGELADDETEGIESYANHVVSEVFDAYVRFLATKLCDDDFDSEYYSPCNVVDELWHEHILDTKGYADVCHQYGGKFVHHQPGISVHEAGKRMANYATRLKTLIGTDEDGEPVQDPHFHTRTDSDWAADGFAYLEFGEQYAPANCG